MKHRLPCLLSFIGLSVAIIAGPARSEITPPSLKSVLDSAHRKDKVLITGKVVRARTLDLFILSDGTAEALVNATFVRTSVAVGDSLVIWGRFMGRSDRQPEFKEIEVIDAAIAGSTEANALIANHPVAIPSPSPQISGVPSPVAMPTPSPVVRSTESRLRELDDLKAKKLVSDEEYREQRKRILSGL